MQHSLVDYSQWNDSKDSHSPGQMNMEASTIDTVFGRNDTEAYQGCQEGIVPPSTQNLQIRK